MALLYINYFKFMKKLLFIFLFSFLILTPFAVSLAQTPPQPPAGDATTPCPTCLDNPLCPSNKPNCTSPQILIGTIINAVLGVVGSLALLMFIYGGLTWMTSGGSAEKVKKGRDIIIWSAIGLAIIFMSYGLVRYIILNIKQ